MKKKALSKTKQKKQTLKKSSPLVGTETNLETKENKKAQSIQDLYLNSSLEKESLLDSYEGDSLDEENHDELDDDFEKDYEEDHPYKNDSFEEDDDEENYF